MYATYFQIYYYLFLDHGLQKGLCRESVAHYDFLNHFIYDEN